MTNESSGKMNICAAAEASWGGAIENSGIGKIENIEHIVCVVHTIFYIRMRNATKKKPPMCTGFI